MRKAVAFCWPLVCLITDVAVAQSTSADRVWLAPGKKTAAQSDWYPQSIKVISGKVDSLNDKRLAILISGDEALSRFAAHRVIWIEPGAMSEKEAAALKLFADGDFAGALRPLIDSLSERPPVWRQQWLSMLAADAAKRSSRGEIALELVSQLDARPLAPYVLAWLPLAWESRPPPAASIQAARGRIDDDSAAVKLVAASWLLSSPSRGDGSRVLKQLSLDPSRPMIAKLAAAVLWRTATPPQVAENASRWQQAVDQLPIVLQTGPMIALAQKFESAGLDREAKRLRLALEMTPALPYPLKW